MSTLDLGVIGNGTVAALIDSSATINWWCFPRLDSDPVFLARKGYYRRPVMAALGVPPQEPMALIAAEHTGLLERKERERVEQGFLFHTKPGD